ncbi:flagellar hook-length control protein FliK [Novosphingobium sp. fls2-241-R2A-195]|uniref:flagellar hook-length control protein FliK n=1 Tax=Novosphingobium sp. fls2-241-R2A-195 TaxID=3040296 RepID=UPI00254BFBA4|nr:flagellar hook-length control protein FliK [Novosphingobium sp. fls2-241-R2A-195]
MPVPVTTLFPTVTGSGTPTPSVGDAEPGAFLAALASVGAKVDGAAQAGEAPPVAAQALPLSSRIAPQVAAASVTAPQAPAEPVGATAALSLTLTDATAVSVPSLPEPKVPEIPAAASAPTLAAASPAANPTAGATVDVPEVPALAATSAEVMAPPVEPVRARPEALETVVPGEDTPPLPRKGEEVGNLPTAAPAQQERLVGAEVSIDVPPVTLAAAGLVEDALPSETPAVEPKAETSEAARPVKRKAAKTTAPSEPPAAASTTSEATGVPIVATAPSASPSSAAAETPEPAAARTAAPVAHAAPQAAEDTATPEPEARVSAPLFTQTLEAATTRPPALPYEIARNAPALAPAEASVSMREGHFGADVGIAIARALDGGPEGLRDTLLIRLDPRHMGRIDVRMGFDDDGTLRAVVSADQPAALDLLRRESMHLDRALSDAGVRADAQSLRFDSSGGSLGSGNGSAGQHRPSARSQGASSEFTGAPEEAAPLLRSLRGSGNLDLMA